jgi:hypothetical protein
LVLAYDSLTQVSYSLGSSWSKTLCPISTLAVAGARSVGHAIGYAISQLILFYLAYKRNAYTTTIVLIGTKFDKAKKLNKNEIKIKI